MTDPVNPEHSPEQQWKPIGRNMRRVFGVLIEKAKTTPDNYPLTVSALISGCKQKSNRDPLMDLDEDEVIEALDQLRSLGAVREVQGSGRVNKYRHCGYEWLDVNAPQSAIMTELMLRGPQTLGELRARAARMEPFNSLDVVSQVVEELISKGLVEPLSPAGRGQTFSHTLYEPHERPKMLSKAGVAVTSSQPAAANPQTYPMKSATSQQRSASSSESLVPRDSLAEITAELKNLSERVGRLETELGIND